MLNICYVTNMSEHCIGPSISPERGAEIFAQQLLLFPDLVDELMILTDGSVDVVKAVMVTMGEAISEDPVSETNPERLRAALRAPTDESLLDQWREDFLNTFKNRTE